MDRATDRHEAVSQPTDPAQANDYDAFAEAYAAENENSVQNAYYERPAMLALAGDVAGRRILDAGCGAGPLSAALRERGADVTGIDARAGMLELARRRLGEDTDLRVVDLNDPLPFADGVFDDVVASLVLHYLRDWGPTLGEIRRVLRPGGRLIASVQHPFADYLIQDPRPDYFATTEYSDEFTFDGRPAVLTFWRRPLHAMTDAFTAAGFRLSVISEPQPDPAARALFPDDFHGLSTRLGFLFFVVEAP
ncbi:methyltransferase family protein [Nocardiopsis sp. Huas11]|uniref:class I SAM-dependent methyltransferase n=1 Tax=Nocardiopsis sp. Huas11 TaxID=2183912 RepID=UPI000EB403EF|nr:class I SAM-dependent methyltransferase [Nocardiopsis sp. Huas11]RKS08173.1 methyltransferase family protein [Nocardiopsis sp. Huas11]